MDKQALILYGAEWCPKTSSLKNFLQSEWIDFAYHNVETDQEAAEQVKKLYDGKLKFPTVTYGEDFIKNPSVADMRQFLKKHHIEG
jgi:mycoredoxin